jgi:hypothetical protein
MIESIGIIGAGTMGNGIAQVCAAAGLTVTMSDISDAAVARGMSTVSGSLERLVNKQKMTEKDREAHYDDHGQWQAWILRPRHRGRDRAGRSEGQDPEGRLRDLEAAGAGRHQHVLDLDHETGRRDRPSGPVHRHALLQSGAADGAIGIDPRPADF